MSRHITKGVTVIVIMLGSNAALAPGDGMARALEVRVAIDPVIAQRREQSIPVIGRFVSRRSGPVAARISGPVSSYAVSVGDRVKKGDVLAVLVKDTLEWRRRQRQADVAVARAAANTATETLKLRRQELERLESLRRSAAFSQARMEDQQQEVVMAEAEFAEREVEIEAARAALELAEINLRYATVRAPYDGVITSRQSEVGAFVNVGEPIVTIVDDGDLEIEADVPSRNIGGLTTGREITARLDNDKAFLANVRAVVPSENPQTRTRAARFKISADQLRRLGALAANQSVTLNIPAATGEQVLTVHKDAVNRRPGGAIVFIAKDGKAVLRPVELGGPVNNRLVVISGLKAGELAVIRGNERLRPGQDLSFDAPATVSRPGPAPEG